MDTSPSKTITPQPADAIMGGVLGFILGLSLLILFWLYQGLPSLLLVLTMAGCMWGWQLQPQKDLLTKVPLAVVGMFVGFGVAYLFMRVGYALGVSELALLPVGAIWLWAAVQTGMRLERWGGDGVVIILLFGTGLALVVVAGIFIRYELRPCGLLDKALHRSTCLQEFSLGDLHASRIALSPDGSLLGGAAYDYGQVWRTDTAERLYFLDESVRDMAFSPDNTLMVIAVDRDYVDILRVNNGEQLHRLDLPVMADINRVAFSPDGSVVAVGGDCVGRIYRVSNGAQHRVLWEKTSADSTPFVYSMAFSPNGKLLAVGFEDGTVGLWQVADGVQIGTLQHSLPEDDYNWVTALAFSRDGTMLASGSGEFLIAVEDNFIKLWRVSDGTHLHTIETKSFVFSLIFSPDDTRLLATSNDGKLRTWAIPTGELLNEQTVYEDTGIRESDIRFTPAGLRLAAASWYDKHIQLWHIPESAEEIQSE